MRKFSLVLVLLVLSTVRPALALEPAVGEDGEPSATGTLGLAALPRLEPALRDEVLSRVELLSQMQFPAAQILTNVELGITPRARAVILSYGTSAEDAVANFRKIEGARRAARSARAGLNRARRTLLDCLAEDRRLDGYRVAVTRFLLAPHENFDAVAAVRDVPVDTRSLKRCLDGLPDLYQAAVVANEAGAAQAAALIERETNVALTVRDAALARAPVSRALERTRDAALGVYYRFSDSVK